MGDPLVSVIVPVYNAEAYLPECVDSIRAQTYPNWEMILIDDGSTDRSGQICEELAFKDTRIRVIHQKNSGVSAARNAGLDAAAGGYVCFVDGDDWVMETMVEESIAVMEREGCDGCAWGYLSVGAGEAVYSGRWEERMFRFPENAEKQRFLCRWILPCRLGWSVWGRVFRREIIQRNGLRFAEGQTMSEDLDFFFRYVACCRNLYYIPKALYAYRQHSASVMHTNTLQMWSSNFMQMIWQQDRELSGQPLFQPFYIYGGTALAVLLDNFMRDLPSEQGLAQAAGCFRKCPEWGYLLEQARLAVRDWRGIRKICGYRLGWQVYGFYRYLLTGDTAVYRRANLIQGGYDTLRALKNRVRHGLLPA